MSKLLELNSRWSSPNEVCVIVAMGTQLGFAYSCQNLAPWCLMPWWQITELWNLIIHDDSHDHKILCLSKIKFTKKIELCPYLQIGSDIGKAWCLDGQQHSRETKNDNCVPFKSHWNTGLVSLSLFILDFMSWCLYNAKRPPQVLSLNDSKENG